MEFIKIDNLKPAEYNPREIDESKLSQLEESIKINGFLLPVIVNKVNNIIIAGHQRSKVAKKIGIDEVPCYYVENIRVTDEIMFNQLHNGTDVDKGVEGFCKNVPAPGFSEVDANDFEIWGGKAQLINEICKLILRYGNVFQCICNLDGKVLKGANYVSAAKVLNIKVNLTVSNVKRIDLLCDLYGEFQYNHLQKNTWVQGLAQMNRSDNKSDGRKRANKSKLYERLVKPFVAKYPESSVLDFGCGKGYYISKLKTKNAIGVEFYNQDGKSIKVNYSNLQINRLINHLKNVGRFDITVCDSVLNSVDSVQAEMAVMRTLNALTKNGGALFISGRCFEDLKYNQTRTKTISAAMQRLTFLDKDKFTGTYRKGNWYYQKFHSFEDVEKLIKLYGFKVIRHAAHTETSWQVYAQKVVDLSIEEQKAGIDFEFNLPLPNNTTYHRNEEVFEALQFALQQENNNFHK